MPLASSFPPNGSVPRASLPDQDCRLNHKMEPIPARQMRGFPFPVSTIHSPRHGSIVPRRKISVENYRAHSLARDFGFERSQLSSAAGILTVAHGYFQEIVMVVDPHETTS